MPLGGHLEETNLSWHIHGELPKAKNSKTNYRRWTDAKISGHIVHAHTKSDCMHRYISSNPCHWHTSKVIWARPYGPVLWDCMYEC